MKFGNSKIGKLELENGTIIYRPDLSNFGEFEVGEKCVFHSNVWIGNGVIIGDRVKVEAFVYIPPGVIIEDDVFIGPGTIFTNDRKINIVESGKFVPDKTIVKRGARIGAGCVIIAGITIGEKSLIGAGSVVSKDVKANTMVYGERAKVQGLP